MRSIPSFAVPGIIEYLSAQKAKGDEEAARLLARATPKRSGIARPAAPGPDRESATKAKREARSAVRSACVERARGLCEACGALRGEALHMDHFWGRAREESVESCWMLCPSCDRQKTDNRMGSEVNRLPWLRAFRKHCQEHGYDAQITKVNTVVILHQAKHPEAA